MPLVFKELASNILKAGYVYEIPESRHKKRIEQGLPQLPKPNLEDVAKIFEVTGSSKILENVKTFEKVKS
jgi:hypothetical protein